MIDFKNKKSAALLREINRNHIWVSDNGVEVSDVLAVQSIIDSFIEPMPTLTNNQYTWFMIYTGLKSTIDLRVSQLTGANAANLAVWFKCGRTYDATYTKVQNIKTELLLVNPTLGVTQSILKAAWLLAATQET
jgi:hypothetical protein